MGDRGNIVFKQEDGDKIFFYTHWHGTEIEKVLRNALKRSKDRWDDSICLARIIFCEMIKNDVDGTTGFGISTTMGDNEHDLLVIDMGCNKIYTTSEDDGGDGKEVIKEWKSFEEFVNNK